MKKQILSLMVGAAVLATSPAFGMDPDLQEQPKSAQRFQPLPNGTEESLKEFSERFYTHVPEFKGANVDIVAFRSIHVLINSDISCATDTPSYET